jgi:N6-adenosine-specific RNA methylase IME4
MTALNQTPESPQNAAGQSLAASPCSAFRCIVADPPWKYGKWGKASKAAYLVSGIREETNLESPLPYPAMSIEEIKALPVAKLAADDCDLYLWVTQKYLPDAFGVLEAWGFRYCQTLTWCKTPRGTGQGGLYCPTTEFLLLGRKGKMPIKKRVDTTWWNVKRPHNCHSAKPEHFQGVIEAVSDGPRLEMFARRKRPGWHSWGNEIESDICMPNKYIKGG